MTNPHQLITPYPVGGPVNINYNFPPSCSHCQALLREINVLNTKVAAIEQRRPEVSKEDFTKFRHAIENRSRAFEKHILGHLISFSKLIHGHIRNLIKERDSLNSHAGEEEMRSLNEKLDEFFKVMGDMDQVVQKIVAGWIRERGTDS
jgi:hypothetical protein